MKKNNIVYIGNTYVYKDELWVVFCTMCIALVGIICVQMGTQMDAEIERQRQIEMTEIAHDKAINNEVTK